MSNKVRSSKTGRYINKKIAARNAKSVAAMSEAKKKRVNEIVQEEKPVAEGVRMVEYKELGKNLKCYICSGILSLENIVEEQVIGIHSILKVNCLKCHKISTVHAGHFENNISRINTAFVLGAMHSGVGQTSLNKILACADSPNMTNNLYKRYEKLVGDAIEKEAKQSCIRAAIEERSLVITKVKDLCKEL